MPTKEIVVGIDFGTTHSGVAWVKNVVPAEKKVQIDDIRVIKDWPVNFVANSDNLKVSSCISYKEDGSPAKYGYLAEKETNVIKWAKILLDEADQKPEMVKMIKTANALLEKLNKTPKDIVTDYLRLLWDKTWKDITQHISLAERKVCKLKVVLTVPAIWSHKAKTKMLQAARAAKLPDDIQLVTEPEAAALGVLSREQNRPDLKVGDCIIICDAGGGTVVSVAAGCLDFRELRTKLIALAQDLISYKIESLEPLIFKEAAVGSGDLCGSVFLDLGFERVVSTLVGQQTYESLPWKRRKDMMVNFEHGIKRSFGDDDEYSVELDGVKATSKYVLDDLIKVPRGMLQPVFDKVCGQIKDLLWQQIQQVKANEKTLVKAIILVGGLGESNYLYDQLKAEYMVSNEWHCEDSSMYSGDTANETIDYSWEDGEGIEIIKSMRPWSAVCEGATLWGVGHSAISSRKARYSYGISINDSADVSTDAKIEKTPPLWRKSQPRRQVKWLVRKGDEIVQGSSKEFELPPIDVNIHFLKFGNHIFQKHLFYSLDRMPSKTLDSSIKNLGSLRISVPYSDLKKNGPAEEVGRTFNKRHWAEFSIRVLLEGTILEFQILYVYRNMMDGIERRGKRQVGSIETKFGDEIAPYLVDESLK